MEAQAMAHDQKPNKYGVEACDFRDRPTAVQGQGKPDISFRDTAAASVHQEGKRSSLLQVSYRENFTPYVSLSLVLVHILHIAHTNTSS